MAVVGKGRGVKAKKTECRKTWKQEKMSKVLETE